MGTYDWLSVKPRGNTRSRRKSKNNLRGITMAIGPTWGITSLTSSYSLDVNRINGSARISNSYLQARPSVNNLVRNSRKKDVVVVPRLDFV